VTQLVTRVGPRVAAQIDELVAEGVVESRSDAVRRGLQILIDQHRRGRIADEIIDGYRRIPQTGDDDLWPIEASIRMIEEEPW
jgi:Arc/MetJ-type ribon-helix-helix transcriptional regulator